MRASWSHPLSRGGRDLRPPPWRTGQTSIPFPRRKARNSSSFMVWTPSLRASSALEPASSPTTTASVDLLTEPVARAPRDSMCAWASRRGGRGGAAGEDPLLPRKWFYGSVPPTGCGGLRLHQVHPAGELVEHLGVVRLGEEGGDLLGHARAHPRDLLEGGLVRREQAGEGAEVPGEVARHGDAHLGDPQAIEEAGELGGGAGLLQGVHQLVGRF